MTRRWPTMRIMLTAHLYFAALTCAALLGVTLVVAVGISVWGEVDRSYWHYVATQFLRWIAFGLGVDAISSYLRMHIAHGRTRRDFLRQLFPYLVGLSVVYAVLVVLGYLLERGVYALTGWPPRREDSPLLDSIPDVLGYVGPFTLMLLLWAIAGVLLSAAFNRDAVLGLVTIPIGLLIIAPSEFIVDVVTVPFLRTVVESLRVTTLAGIGLGLAGIAIGCVAIWGIVRDMPMRPKVA
ncbi:hypothetical protein [Actinophytocola sp.]|uniref:hypothetical protein n=1 Tax=Actinophytocola sp. TaxID=1872138 RepID=UPI002ED28AED